MGETPAENGPSRRRKGAGLSKVDKAFQSKAVVKLGSGSGIIVWRKIHESLA